MNDFKNCRVKRRYESWKKFGTPVFDSLKAVRYPKLADGKVSLPSLQTADLLSKVLGCEVIVSTAAMEADEETVRIARARGAFAILGQDSDYLMYDTGDVAYLSLKHFGTCMYFALWEYLVFNRTCLISSY